MVALQGVPGPEECAFRAVDGDLVDRKAERDGIPSQRASHLCHGGVPETVRGGGEGESDARDADLEGGTMPRARRRCGGRVAPGGRRRCVVAELKGSRRDRSFKGCRLEVQPARGAGAPGKTRRVAV